MEPNILQYIGAGLATLIGLNGLFRPVMMGKAVGLSYSNLVGLVEIRVLFGCFMVALPLYIFFQNQQALFELMGVVALAEIISISLAGST